MEMLFKRYFWTLPLAVVCLAAALAAMAASQVVEAALISDDAAPARRARPAAKPTAEAKSPATKDADAIISRNIFCSTCQPEPPAATAVDAPVVDAGGVPATTLPLALVGTLVGSRARDSLATVVNTQTFHSGAYSVDDMIPHAGTVVAIGDQHVDFRNEASKRVERISLLAPAPPPLVAANTPPPPPPSMLPPPEAGPATPESELLAQVDKGVRKIDDSRYEIDRSLVDKVLGDPSVVMRQARVVPSVKNGQMQGFKLYAIRPNSVYAKIGLQNGDTLQAVNGFELTSADKALEVYSKARSASNLSLTIIRRGQPVQMEYSIR